MKRIIATLLAVMIVVSAFGAMNASAEIGYGNVDKKDGITTNDALLVLQSIVGITELDNDRKPRT